jgi:hypothetical protein
LNSVVECIQNLGRHKLTLIWKLLWNVPWTILKSSFLYCVPWNQKVLLQGEPDQLHASWLTETDMVHLPYIYMLLLLPSFTLLSDVFWWSVFMPLRFSLTTVQCDISWHPEAGASRAWETAGSQGWVVDQAKK